MILKMRRPLGLGQSEDAKKVSKVHLIHHFSANFPIKIYKVRAQENKDLYNEFGSRLSPILVFKTKTKQTCEDVVQPGRVIPARYLWAVNYNSTLTTIAKAMFEDFSESDAEKLQEHMKLT